VSDASAEAMRLLADVKRQPWTAEQGPQDDEWRVLKGGPRSRHDVGDSTDEGTIYTPNDAALIAAACSPEGGLLATLAAEVEKWERDAVGDVLGTVRMSEVHVWTQEDIVALKARQGHLGWLGEVRTILAENARLRKAMESMRRPHDEFGEEGEDVAYRCPALDGGACTCGADEHNDRIDAALRGEDG